jgi:hypothetical protein
MKLEKQNILEIVIAMLIVAIIIETFRWGFSKYQEKKAASTYDRDFYNEDVPEGYYEDDYDYYDADLEAV